MNKCDRDEKEIKRSQQNQSEDDPSMEPRFNSYLPGKGVVMCDRRSGLKPVKTCQRVEALPMKKENVTDGKGFSCNCVLFWRDQIEYDKKLICMH